MTMPHPPAPCTWPPLLCSLCNALAQDGGAHTVLLYGSRANGSEDQDSDYDIAAFDPREAALQPGASSASVRHAVVCVAGAPPGAGTPIAPGAPLP